MKAKLDLYGRCPHCNTQWGYEVGGESYSHVIGVEGSDRDEIIE